MNETVAAAALVAGNSLSVPLRGGDESTTWLGSEEHTLNRKLPKTRKPYTITKQRERWSEEEHLKFVEALRLHGRAWRKIEEHIGTKTAVQIRSHAQKFFNKLEKKKETGEAVEKEEDFTIPPPRPKRKPAKPYPRKDGASFNTGTSQLQFSPDAQTAQQHCFEYGSTQTADHGVGRLADGFPGPSAATAVSDATVAAVTAAASAAAAAAAAAVVAAAGQEVQTHMQAHPPSCFPFFGLPPSALAQITPTHGVSALNQAALLAPQAAAAKLAALSRLADIGVPEAMAPAARVVSGDALELSAMVGALGADGTGVDRGLVEATGTTDGTHTSGNAQLRGSDGDSACSRETDNQDDDPSLALDASWQSKLHAQGMPYQDADMGSTSPSAAAVIARSLAAAAQAAGYDPSHLSWGAGSPGYDAAAAVLQSLGPAQALALLSHPLYQAALAAVDRNGHHAPLQAAAAVAGLGGSHPVGAPVHHEHAVLDAGMTNAVRTKSHRTAPSGNSGSTGPPAGTKRMLSVGSEECLLPIKKVARNLSDTGEEGEGMEVTPSSPSIQEKELKAVSQPSNTNGNTSGSNESEGSKRRQGTAQAEVSIPTHGNSSGNGYSVKDSNTGTNTGTNDHGNGNGNGYSCANGTSAFSPLGHHVHHHHHHHQPITSTARRSNHHSSTNQQQEGGNGAGVHHYSGQPHGGETSNGGNGASGTGFAGMRDEGRSSSDLEGPAQQPGSRQQQLQCEVDAEDDVMVPVESAEMYQQHSESDQAAQLQAFLASLHGMHSNPLVLQQAYGAAAAAAASAQQIVANAMQHSKYQQDVNGTVNGSATAQQQIAALQQQIRQHSLQNAPVSQGFAPWHTNGCEFDSSASYVSHGLLQQLGMNAAASQQLQAAAGLAGFPGTWNAGSVTGGDDGGAAAFISTYAQLAAAAVAQQQQQQQQKQQQQHTHHHNHYHYHEKQQQEQSASAAAAAAAVSLQQLQQGLMYSSTNTPTVRPSSLDVLGYSGLSGLEVLTRAASADALACEEAAAAGGVQKRWSQQGHGGEEEQNMPSRRQSRTF